MSSDSGAISSSDGSSSGSDSHSDATWQERYEKLKKTNEKLAARVYRLTQREYQVTDDKVVKKYRQIRANIDSWIDELEEEERRDFRIAYHENFHSSIREKLFADLGLKAGCLEERWQERLGRLETCIYVVLGLAISRSLQSIFDRQHPVGITKAQMKFINSIRNSAPFLNDPAIFHRWKGETLSGIVSTSEFAREYQHDTDKLSRMLKQDVMIWFSSHVLPKKYEKSLREKILKPAIDFHQMIHCSGKGYVLAYRHLVESPVPNIAADCDLIDIASWRVLKNKDEIRGTFRCLLPGLIMKHAIDQKKSVFVSPILLGYRSPSLNPSRTNSPTRQEGSGRERGSEPPTRHRSSSSHTSRGSAPQSYKLKLSSTSWFEKILPRPPSRADGRSDGGSSRKSSYSAPPSSPSRTGRQDFGAPRQSASFPIDSSRGASPEAALTSPSGERRNVLTQIISESPPQVSTPASNHDDQSSDDEEEEDRGTDMLIVPVPIVRSASLSHHGNREEVRKKSVAPPYAELPPYQYERIE